MAKLKKSKKHYGVYQVKGISGISYGIDYVHPANGQRVRKIIKGCTSEQMAVKIRSIEIADLSRGRLSSSYGLKKENSALLFSVMLDEYLQLYSKSNKEYRTDKQRSVALKSAFSGKLLSDINPFVIEKFKRVMLETRAKTTINKYLCLGSQVFSKAIEWGKYKGDNPFLKVKRFRIEKAKKPGSLTPDQVQAIISEIKHSTKKNITEFIFYTGWRIREVLNLLWQHVDFERGTAWIINPKNRNSVEVELSESALSVLRNQNKNGEYVFCMNNGSPYKTGIHAAFTNAARRAGVDLPKRKAWHILRRTWASQFLQAGGDVETLRVLGNWKDYSMPMYYADAASREHKKKVLNQIPVLSGRNKAEIENVVSITNRYHEDKKTG
jgi:integrase